MAHTAETQPSELGGNDDHCDETLGALAALGGSGGNGRLRDVLEWADASCDAVKAVLLNRGLVEADPPDARGLHPAAAQSSTTPSTPPGCCSSVARWIW